MHPGAEDHLHLLLALALGGGGPQAVVGLVPAWHTAIIALAVGQVHARLLPNTATRSSLLPMADELGLWQIAHARPGMLAVVSPDGRETTYAELAAMTNRYSHGLRSLGLSTGDSVAVLLPNGVEMLALYFAALQSGLYLVPVNWHLVGPEVAYIVGDSEADVFVAHERFAEAATYAADEAGVAGQRRFAVGSIEGFCGLDELAEGQPDTLPE